MHTCSICGTANSVTTERLNTGKTHCMSQSCVNTWRQRRQDETGLRLVNMHKQGPAWVYLHEVADNSYRRTGA